ncbi:flagellar hook-length control protein [Mycolicibacterium elephantis]|uniref:Flagellar hook-length control protein n=1 Tax=Mycolicibacterium elephantis DSM 44368 TaxID=1335622 RepID=A0A439DXX2_9MYCO|nr:flagellar hook-length control protein [Mycolicibacterium elephantis]MCV7223633.1 flagellar hook-length control protein [Mycolicibacterium elephantis]RWA22347.1 hypothetical protein MELE44368_13120 [Mycolicibacterium elephantis DSM 44368]
MTRTVNNEADIVTAAMSVARDAAEGKIDPAALEQQAVTELGRLFSDVVGQDDPLWPLQLDVARQVLALGGVSADELNEWAAALRHRDAEPSSTADPATDPPEAVSAVSEALSPESDALDADPDVDIDQPGDVETQPALDASRTDDGCGCAGTAPATVTLADGRQVPAHRVAARGRGLPTVY